MSLSIFALFLAFLGLNPADSGGMVPIATTVMQPADSGGMVPIANAQPADSGGMVPVK